MGTYFEAAIQAFGQGRNLTGYGGEQPSKVEENLPFCRAKAVVHCTSAGQFRTNAKQLLLRKTDRKQKFLQSNL